jgi:hypothetical protein
MPKYREPTYSTPSNEVEARRTDLFPDLTKFGDPALRLVAWLIRNKDFRQLEQRTGIRKPVRQQGEEETKAKQSFPALLKLVKREIEPLLHKDYGVPEAYGRALESNKALTYVTARLPVDAGIFNGSVDVLVHAVQDLTGRRGVRRICLGAPGQPSRNERSMTEVGLPNRRYKTKKLTGKKVLVGIIDDGCALADCNFLKPRAAGAKAKSRILYLWDQAGTGNAAAGWTTPPGFYGLQLDDKAIDKALNLPAHKNGDLIREDLVYKYLGYPMREVETHGTHVMDIATGNGQSLMGVEGIAPEADIIFVQLPTEAIEGGATVLWRHILDAVVYILDRASKAKGPDGKKPAPAVVNISYGGYDGAHDGTSDLELALDELLAEADRAVVIAAGNGFEARCHAVKPVAQNAGGSFRWIVNPQDPTANDLDIWYDKKSELQVRLSSPGPALDPAGWIAVGQSRTPIMTTTDGKTVGYIEHLENNAGGVNPNNANRIVITLNATDAAAGSGVYGPAPSGTWLVEVRHVSGPDAVVHAWIWRDDSGRPKDARLRQSRFHPDDADPASSISGWATGQKTISVGAYNSATQEICGYSACGPTGPTGPTPGREKPEVYAPAEEDVRGRGVLSASALSANPSRMNGTSASAPHISALIALIFEYAKKHAHPPKSLLAGDIGQELKAAANAGVVKLRLNRHQKVDARVEKKQKDVEGDLRVSDKVNCTEAMKKLAL